MGTLICECCGATGKERCRRNCVYYKRILKWNKPSRPGVQKTKCGTYHVETDPQGGNYGRWHAHRKDIDEQLTFDGFPTRDDAKRYCERDADERLRNREQKGLEAVNLFTVRVRYSVKKKRPGFDVIDNIGKTAGTWVVRAEQHEDAAELIVKWLDECKTECIRNLTNTVRIEIQCYKDDGKPGIKWPLNGDGEVVFTVERSVNAWTKKFEYTLREKPL